ncbi:hypothetical protein [Devosia sp.]|uniref:hypothetical protein n=1 Tax=Devosia sp. TaxID=1871048 RepID=UPI002931EAD7|nr:hypothetical protein [Devosia sp.]
MTRIGHLLALFAALTMPAAAQTTNGVGTVPMTTPQAMTSPHRITINQVFHWASQDSGVRHSSPPSPDCKLFGNGLQELQGTASERVAHLSSWDAHSFLMNAFYGQDLSAYENYATDVVVQYLTDDGVTVHVGNREMNLLCGFAEVQTISPEWADAGIAGKPLFTPPRPLSFTEQLSAALAGRSYAIAESSISARGFHPAPSDRPTVERCGIGLELICDAHANARCNMDALGRAICEFDWAAPEDELVVFAQIVYLNTHYHELTVLDVQPLGH